MWMRSALKQSSSLWMCQGCLRYTSLDIMESASGAVWRLGLGDTRGCVPTKWDPPRAAGKTMVWASEPAALQAKICLNNNLKTFQR